MLRRYVYFASEGGGGGIERVRVERVCVSK